jgi:ornithine cyclodeaminase
MHYLTDETLDRLLTYETLVPALKRMHLMRPSVQEDMLLEQPAGGGGLDRLLNRAAWQQGEALGVKLATIFPNNPTNGSGRPSVQGVYILFGGELGEPQAVMDALVLTWRKTAADSALGASFLARQDAESLLMVGAGAMAPELIRAHLSQRPSVQRVAIWNRRLEKTETLAGELAATLPGKSVSAAPDLEAAVREADIVSCATMAEEPLIKGAWLKPGCHLDLVGAYTPTMREADDEALKRGRLFVDSRATTVGHIGELMIPMAAGVIGEEDIQADLFQLSEGSRAGRGGAEEITLFKNGGGGHLDLMTARHGLERAKEEGLL